ncbi:MAG: helix-turn-helix transcriptional regulator [Candidatus Nitrosotenuis sp.]|uniref:winged helix-turn-helix transcriptional regulator n=1 Tax=Candidatus Nitrosotenuis cloacae TaxID=1603555 RepID=UPI00227E15B3|nr:helix-turn-helix domain-containing protein [Candidatus Nitrosotenuis cloacae]MDC8438040.1 helix-turn-helix transcriptional regulator [Candidatus Nitrosotenuis sp.]
MQSSDYISPFLSEMSRFVGKRWNFRVLWELRNRKVMRYNEILESLHGISPSTLADVLKSLQKEMLVKRAVYGKTPPLKVEYSITQKGLDLIVASSPLVKWAIQKGRF